MQSNNLPLPYPTIEGPCGVQDAKLLADDYAGREGEMTAIAQYMFQHTVLKDEYPELAADLEAIALGEMQHYELLADAITRCGGLPYVAGSHCFWSGSAVTYDTEALDAVRADIAGEIYAIGAYKRTIQKVKNVSLQNLLRRIIADEQTHLRLLRQWEARLLRNPEPRDVQE